MFRPRRLHVLFAATAAALGCTSAPAGADDATIVRDKFGVPHIFARSEAAGLYALGYAQAEDRLAALLRNYKQAKGELAELDGQDALPGDVETRAFRLHETAREKYATISKESRADIEAFASGINRFQRDHPEKKPAWAWEVTPFDIVAFAQFVNLFFARDPFEQGPPASSAATPGSNGFVVAAKKLASGKGALVSLDPHLPFNGFLRWYEAHLVCGPLNVVGVNFAGLPLIAMGHNEHVAWANTVNLPDLADWYEIRLAGSEGAPTGYEYEGKTRPLIERAFTFRIRQPLGGALREEKRTVRYTHHGPLLLRDPLGKWYARRKAGIGDLGLFDQTRAQCLARNVDDYRKAIAGRHVVLFNHLFADDKGRIGYVWGGRIPRRPAGHDFRAPVPGWTKETEWGDPIPFAELPQTADPPEGFLKNANDGPAHATPNAPRKDFPAWLAPDMRTLRSDRLAALLSGDVRLTPNAAKAVATDTLDLQAEQQLPALLNAARTEAGKTDTPDADKTLLAGCARVLAAWDGKLTADARGAALFQLWLNHPLIASLVPPAFVPGNAPAASPVARLNPEAATRALRETAHRLRAANVPLDVPWGIVHRHRRGTVNLPLDGGGESLVPNVGPLGADGTITAVFGSSYRMLVELGNGPRPRAWSVAPYGNSDDPASPHFADQMPLAARREYRPVPFTRQEVEAEATSRKMLAWPEK